MSKVTVEMNVRAAAAVRQVLFDAQKGYTTDSECIPERIVEIRNVIVDIDTGIEGALNG
jgi:hypothetical protein